MRLLAAALIFISLSFHFASAHAGEKKLRVMSFNIKGLPWPLVSGKSKRFKAIGDKLGQLRLAGVAPEVLLLQEGFEGPIDEIIERGGYKYFAKGPNSKLCSAEEAAKKKNPAKCKVSRLLNAGLWVVSDYPITNVQVAAFGNGKHCTGWDCKSNKGLMSADIQVPGLTVPVRVLTTHMNSNGASGSPEEEVWQAQRLQLQTIKNFMTKTIGNNPAGAVIFAGDFNVKTGQPVYSDMMAAVNMPDIGLVCAANVPECEIPSSTIPSDLHEKVDHHFAASGTKVSSTPIFASHSMTLATDGRDYSDHPAYTVVYSLREGR